jgi:hypothetical protein
MFTSGDRLSPPDDLPSLTALVTTSQNYTRIDTRFYLERERRQLRDAIFANCSLSRATNLTFLRLQKDFLFFEPTLAGDMFDFVEQVPQRVVHHFRPAIAQVFAFLLTRIHSDLDSFVALLSAYFMNDATTILSFAYSTFPAIFGFFTLDHFCDLGAALILRVLADPTLTTVAAEMIRSFFFSAYRFFDALPAGSAGNAAYSAALKTALEIAIPCLSSGHASVLMQLAAIDHSLFLSVLFRDLFAFTLMQRAPYLKKCVDFFYKCAQVTSAERLSTDVLFLLTRCHHFSPLVPPAPLSAELPLLAFTMSDRDFLIIIDVYRPMLVTEESGSTLTDWAARHQNVSYAPFYLEIPMRVGPRQTVKPPHFEIDSEFAFLYNRIKFEAGNAGLTVVSQLPGSPLFVPLPGRPPRPRWEAFERAVMRQVLVEQQQTFDQLEQALALLQLTREVIAYRGAIQRTRARLLDHFAMLYLVERMNAEKVTVELAGKKFARNDFLMRNVKPKLIFHSWVAILNLMDQHILPNDRSTRKLRKVFGKHVRSIVTPRVVAWITENIELAKSLGKVRRGLLPAQEMRLGERLRAFVEMVDLIAALASAGREKRAWQVMFEYVVIALDPDLILDSFVTWNATVLNDESRWQFTGDGHQESLDHLVNGFLTMSVGSAELQRDLGLYLTGMGS